MRFSQVTTVSLFVVTAVTGFSIHHSGRIIRPRTILCTSTYGRGAEIWPECNEDSINLADSFPGGVVPSQPTPPPAAETSPLASIDKTPAGIALALLLGGLVRPLDVLVATGIGGYLTVLHFLAKAPRSDGVTPHVPALPPQGHVPDLVLNPLGVFFTKSKEYDSWLKAGTVLSLLAPVAAIAKYTLMSSNNQMAAARACARPLFLLCCQAVVESISRGVMASLPLRILAPIAFNTARLFPLWLWATACPSLGVAGRLLAMANLAYWSVNLFGFLVPIAAMRYMRAYFLGVEAEEVTTRPGFENSVGLLPP